MVIKLVKIENTNQLENPDEWGSFIETAGGRLPILQPLRRVGFLLGVFRYIM
jgi:hypothetical protein